MNIESDYRSREIINGKPVTIITDAYTFEFEQQTQKLYDYLFSNAPPAISGVIQLLGELPDGSLITEEGLANILGRCKATIKNAVVRKELPIPIRFMGKNTWTVDFILGYIEKKLTEENIKFSKFSP